MDIEDIKKASDIVWEQSVLPPLKEYITIPAISPAYDKSWEQNGYLLKAAQLIETWCRQLGLNGCDIRLITPQGRTPLLLIDVQASDTKHTDTVLFYGHIDKQPEFSGWDDNKGPWKPVIENDRLYGRGGADDAYSVFCAMSAIKILQDKGLPHERCVLLIESAEESGSFDLDYYLDEYQGIIGTPSLVICLDSGCGDYERMWLTTSLRGGIFGVLTVKILTDGIHSGGSGAVASSFRIMRQLLDRIEDAETGDILIDELHAPVPEHRLEQMKVAAQVLGEDIITAFPLVDGATPVTDDRVQLLINQTWKPTLSYTGIDGVPALEKAGNVLRPKTSLALSFRLSPTADPQKASRKIKSVLEADPPYGAHVTFESPKTGNGWEMPELDPVLDRIIRQSGLDCYGREVGFLGEGGGIPLMNMLSKRFPKARFIVTGVLGPHSNAHGPNEFLHIPFVKTLTSTVACILSRRCGTH